MHITFINIGQDKPSFQYFIFSEKIAAYLHQIIKKEATTKRSSDHGSFFKITALIYSVAQLK